MNNPDLPVSVIACRVFESLLEERYKEKQNIHIEYIEYGLHRVPKKLNEVIQDRIDKLSEPNLIILGFGLCGKGLSGIQAGIHQLIIPKTDDCIAILMGSYARYQKEFLRFPGTYYLSKGWLETGSNPLQEFYDLEKKYGTKKAEWIMDQQYRNYRRLAFVAHSHEDLVYYRPKVQEIAAYCSQWGMVYEEILGSDEYIEKLISKPFSINHMDDDFLVIFPGEEIKMEKFLR